MTGGNSKRKGALSRGDRGWEGCELTGGEHAGTAEVWMREGHDQAKRAG